jgi:hypothetical protein
MTDADQLMAAIRSARKYAQSKSDSHRMASVAKPDQGDVYSALAYLAVADVLGKIAEGAPSE